MRWFWDDDGCLVIKGRLTPEQGAVFQQAIGSGIQQLFEEQKDVPAGTSAEDQLGDILPRPQPVSSLRADALVRICEGFLSGKSPGKLTGNAGNFVVNLHTDIETLKAAGSGAESLLEAVGVGQNTGHVPAETSRRIACDAGLIHWLDNQGEPLSIGRMVVKHTSTTWCCCVALITG